jgi:hypothetical protein
MTDLINELLKISNCSQRYIAKVLEVSKERVRKEAMGNAPKEPSDRVRILSFPFVFLLKFFNYRKIKMLCSFFDKKTSFLPKKYLK